jgi:hypothetical protein
MRSIAKRKVCLLSTSHHSKRGDFAPKFSSRQNGTLSLREHDGYSLSSIMQIADGKVLHLGRLQGIMKRI